MREATGRRVEWGRRGGNMLFTPVGEQGSNVEDKARRKREGVLCPERKNRNGYLFRALHWTGILTRYVPLDYGDAFFLPHFIQCFTSSD